MGIKDILVHASNDAAAATRLDVAAKLAAVQGARVTALHVKAPVFAALDLGAGAPAELFDILEKLEEEKADAAHKEVDDAAKRTGQALEWRLARGEAESVLAFHARYADLVIVSQGTDDENGVSPASVALDAGVPTLVMPAKGRVSNIGQDVLIAWNRSREAARAVHDAMPLLTRARKVIVMEVNPEREMTPHLGGADIAAHLARHGVKVAVQSSSAIDMKVGEIIASRVSDLGVDLLVMGAYGHSRMREIAFGGVTRYLLENLTVPTLLSH